MNECIPLLAAALAALAVLAALAAGRRERVAADAARLDRRLAALRPEVTHVQGR